MKIKIDTHNCGFFTYRSYTNSTKLELIKRFKTPIVSEIYVSQTINIIKQIGL